MKEIVISDNCAFYPIKWTIEHNCVASSFLEVDLKDLEKLPIECIACRKVLIRKFTKKDKTDKTIMEKK